jgi:hypothetical protein
VLGVRRCRVCVVVVSVWWCVVVMSVWCGLVSVCVVAVWCLVGVDAVYGVRCLFCGVLFVYVVWLWCGGVGVMLRWCALMWCAGMDWRCLGGSVVVCVGVVRRWRGVLFVSFGVVGWGVDARVCGPVLYRCVGFSSVGVCECVYVCRCVCGGMLCWCCGVWMLVWCCADVWTWYGVVVCVVVVVQWCGCVWEVVRCGGVCCRGVRVIMRCCNDSVVRSCIRLCRRCGVVSVFAGVVWWWCVLWRCVGV